MTNGVHIRLWRAKIWWIDSKNVLAEKYWKGKFWQITHHSSNLLYFSLVKFLHYIVYAVSARTWCKSIQDVILSEDKCENFLRQSIMYWDTVIVPHKMWLHVLLQGGIWLHVALHTCRTWNKVKCVETFDICPDIGRNMYCRIIYLNSQGFVLKKYSACSSCCTVYANHILLQLLCGNITSIAPSHFFLSYASKTQSLLTLLIISISSSN